MTNSTIELSKNLRSIADSVKKQIINAAGESIPFTLIVYTKGRASYISNLERDDSIAQLKELLELWENEMPDIPAHDFQ